MRKPVPKTPAVLPAAPTAAALALGLWACKSHPSGDIAWTEGLAAGHAAAAARDRPVVAYFHFEGCGACRRLESVAFADPAVAARAADYVWVDVDRDDRPELVERFHVVAFPSLLWLGPHDENIHRLAGFREPDRLCRELDEVDRRWQLYRAGRPWDEYTPRDGPLVDGVPIETFPAPTHLASTGIVFRQGELWIAHLYDRLYRIDPATGEVIESFALPGLNRDLCTDGELIYALDASWTAGGPIRAIDPRSGRVVREIVTVANRDRSYSPAQGLAFRDGHLWVLDGGELKEVDPQDGAVLRTLPTGLAEASGMDVAGDRILVGGDECLSILDAGTGELVRRIPLNGSVRSVAWRDGSMFLTEQPVWGYDREHTYEQLWPLSGGGRIHRVDGL